MIISLKNKKGFIFAYFEWDVVDILGRQSNEGKYMYVRDIWVHKWYDGKKLIGKFIRMLNKCPENDSVEYIYWNRFKDKVQGDKRISRLFKREVCLRRQGLLTKGAAK